MSTDLSEFKCPNCGGPMTFDSNTQKMKCPYCGSEYTIEEYDKLTSEKNPRQPVSLDWKTSQGQWQDNELGNMVEYVCKSCGGTILTDKTTSASTCPFCGNPVVMNEQVSGALKPELIVPFQLDKEAAKDGLRKHLQGRRLLPKVFAEEDHIDEIKGVYVPFWLFDADIHGETSYRATRSRTWTEPNATVIETSYYQVNRGGDMAFHDVPVDGSSKTDDTLMESLEPFDVGKAVPFTAAYLSGYYASKYDVSKEDTFGRANERIDVSVNEVLDSTVNAYMSVVPLSSHIQLTGGSAHYALLPVWLLSTTWQGHNYLFAMNGQTGKFVGDLPTDTGAATRMALTYGLIAAGVVFAVFAAMGLM